MIILFALIAYTLGSIPFGLILCRLLKGIDIREYGSKNIGATNVFRTVGKGLGIAVFGLDVLKGVVAVILPSALFAVETSLTQQLFLGFAAIFGHAFPVWLKFRGGKGVATSLGVFVMIAPAPALLSFGIFLAAFGISRILSIGSLVAAIAFPITVFFFYSNHPEWPALQMVAIVLSLFIFITHRANLQRIIRGEEKSLF